MTAAHEPNPTPTSAPAGETIVPIEDVGERLDRFLMRRFPDRSRSYLQRLVEEGDIMVNEKPSRAGYRLRGGDRIAWRFPARPLPSLEPEEIPLDVVYEDDDLLVINKPKGMVVHPAPGHWTGTLVNALLARGGSSRLPIPPPWHDDSRDDGSEASRTARAGPEVFRPGIVHRLDRDTSGLMVVAKNEDAFAALQRQIQRRAMDRRYLAVVRGCPRFERATVEAPVGRHPQDRKRMVVLPRGTPAARAAVTHLTLLESFPGYAVLEAKLETGRTHQIRVHCAYIGHPVVGDATYGPERPNDSAAPAEVQKAIAALDGQALHAASLAFTHPRTGEPVRFTAPPPPDTARLLEALGSTSGVATGTST